MADEKLMGDLLGKGGQIINSTSKGNEKVKTKKLSHRSNKYQTALNSVARQNRLIANKPSRIKISLFSSKKDEKVKKKNRARSLFSFDAQRSQLWGTLKKEVKAYKN
jgi:hypothetical protein